jgi:hypothetical protein
LDSSLTTLLCKQIIVTKSKEVKPGWSNSRDKSGKIFEGRLWLKIGCFASDDDGDDDIFGTRDVYLTTYNGKINVHLKNKEYTLKFLSSVPDTRAQVTMKKTSTVNTLLNVISRLYNSCSLKLYVFMMPRP